MRNLLIILVILFAANLNGKNYIDIRKKEMKIEKEMSNFINYIINTNYAKVLTYFNKKGAYLGVDDNFIPFHEIKKQISCKNGPIWEHFFKPYKNKKISYDVFISLREYLIREKYKIQVVFEKEIRKENYSLFSIDIEFPVPSFNIEDNKMIFSSFFRFFVKSDENSFKINQFGE